MPTVVRLCLIGGLVVGAHQALSTSAHALNPAPVAGVRVLKPDVKDVIIGLIADVGFERVHPGGWAFRSISISPSAVVFRLMGPGDAERGPGRAEIRLFPRGVRPKARRRAQSFDIVTDVRTDDAQARQLIDRAVASIIKFDRGGFFTVTEGDRVTPPPPKRPGLRAWPALSRAAPGYVVALLCLFLLWFARRRGWSAHPTEVRERPQAAKRPDFLAVSWMEVPGYALLWAALAAAPVALVVGTSAWPGALLFFTLVLLAVALRRGWLRITGGLVADLSRADAVVACVIALVTTAWLREGLQDDAFCHHAFVALAERGLPIAAPGDPSQAVGYHVGFDVLASAVFSWMPLGGDIEWALDFTSFVVLLAVGGATVSLVRRFEVSDIARAAAVALFMLGSGPLWLGRWLPGLVPEGAPWATFWEGGTYMSLLSLAGRRSSAIGFLVIALFMGLLADGAFSARRLRGRRGWGVGILLGLLAGGASQSADEMALLVVVGAAVAALWHGRAAVRAMGRPVLVMVCMAPLALLSGGFAAVMLGHFVGSGGLGGGEVAGSTLTLASPSWPSFHLGSVSIGTLDWLRVAALEFGPVVLAAMLLWHRKVGAHRSMAVVTTLWLGAGLLAAQTLQLPSLGYEVDMHRLLEPGMAVSLVVAPVALWRLLPGTPRVRDGVVLALAWLHIVPATGQLFDRADAVPVAVAAAALGGLWAAVHLWPQRSEDPATSPESRPRSGVFIASAGVVVAAAGLLSAGLWAPQRHVLPPPPLPPEAAAELTHAAPRAPVLTTTRLGNLLLLQGHHIAAPHLRSDLNPMESAPHQRWLAQVTPRELQRLQVTTFLLSHQRFRQLQRRFGDRVTLHAQGGWPAAAMPRVWRSWLVIPSAVPAPERVMWGTVGYAEPREVSGEPRPLPQQIQTNRRRAPSHVRRRQTP